MRNGPWRSESEAGIRSAPQWKRWYRTIFISDTHLGTSGCKAELLADFLAHNHCQTLYLVGDIIDGWRLKQNWSWNKAHTAVLNLILRKAATGTRVIYVPGNHDEAFRDYCGLMFGGVELKRESIHETADGRRLLVTHGDQFDRVISCARWLAFLGDAAYDYALMLNDVFNVVRCWLGLPYWSLSAYLKHRVKKIVSYIGSFEQILAREAKTRGFDGVVAGHIHHAETKFIDGVLYCNNGDWVESCTALTEDAHGGLKIVQWREFAAGETVAVRPAAIAIQPDYAAA